MSRYPIEPLPQDSFDFGLKPTSNNNAIPVDLELVLLNDVSGDAYDQDDFAAADQSTSGSTSSIAFEVHCVRVITQNDAITAPTHDDWLSLG